jgi:hypothetical protein
LLLAAVGFHKGCKGRVSKLNTKMDGIDPLLGSDAHDHPCTSISEPQTSTVRRTTEAAPQREAPQSKGGSRAGSGSHSGGAPKGASAIAEAYARKYIRKESQALTDALDAASKHTVSVGSVDSSTGSK